MTIGRILGRKYFGLSGALALVGVFLALTLSLGTSAQNQTLFSDNFEDGNANGWSKSGGSWSVVSDGSLVYRQSGTSSDARARAGSTSWTNYSVQARVKPLSFNGSNRFVALIARAQGSTNYYYLALSNSHQLLLRKLVGGTSTTLAAKSLTVTTGTWYTLRIDVVGASLWGYLNGALEFTATDSQFSSGNIGGATFFSSAEFADFTVTSLSGPPAPVPPAAPTGLSATPGATQVALSWGASSGATSYNVKRATTSGGPYATIASVASTNYANTGLTNGVTYYFVVSAVNSAGESANSAQVSATPADIPPPPDPPADAPIGFAAVNALGQNGTTGGAGGPVVSVSTASEFLDYISRSGPYTIIVEGMITLPGPMHDVTSHKTIVGRGANSGITGGGLNIGGPVNDSSTPPPDGGVRNIIIMTIHYAGPTGRMVQRSNVFVGMSGAPDVGGGVIEPSAYYGYALQNASDIKTIVTQGAGVGKIGF